MMMELRHRTQSASQSLKHLAQEYMEDTDDYMKDPVFEAPHSWWRKHGEEIYKRMNFHSFFSDDDEDSSAASVTSSSSTLPSQMPYLRLHRIDVPRQRVESSENDSDSSAASVTSSSSTLLSRMPYLHLPCSWDESSDNDSDSSVDSVSSWSESLTWRSRTALPSKQRNILPSASQRSRKRAADKGDLPSKKRKSETVVAAADDVKIVLEIITIE